VQEDLSEDLREKQTQAREKIQDDGTTTIQRRCMPEEKKVE
jgi:hypothetical protein